MPLRAFLFRQDDLKAEHPEQDNLKAKAPVFQKAVPVCVFQDLYDRGRPERFHCFRQIFPNQSVEFAPLKQVGHRLCRIFHERLRVVYSSIKQKIHVDYFDFYKIMIQQTCLYPKVNHFNFIGSYRSHDRSNISDSIESSSRHYMRNNQELGVSEISISYLDSIITLCNHNSITPIIIVSPVHKSYYKRIPKEISIRFEDILNDLDAEDVIVIDKSNSRYYDNEFYNSDHLNTKGSFRFTKSIKNIIKTDLNMLKD